jgi:endonuclease V-like protein UPF0215 family
MQELNFSIRHHMSLDAARTRLEETVRDTQTQFGSMIHRVEWSADRNTVTLAGIGFTGKVWVDGEEVHAVIDVPLLGTLLASPLVTGLKGLLERRFKQLPG